MVVLLERNRKFSLFFVANTQFENYVSIPSDVAFNFALIFHNFTIILLRIVAQIQDKEDVVKENVYSVNCSTMTV